MGRRYDRCISRSEEHTSELQSHHDLVCRLLLEKKKPNAATINDQHQHTTQIPRLIVVSLAGDHESISKRRTLDRPCWVSAFFFNDTATTEIYTLSLHDALPI